MDVPFCSAINTLIKACELVYKLAEVSEESSVFVRSILRVRDDLQETERLLHSPHVKSRLDGLPEKRKWIKKVILDAKQSLNEIGQYIERARADKERDGTVSLTTRWQWVMSDHDKLKNRREEVSTCHTSLGHVLNYLVPLENRLPPTESMSLTNDVSPPSYDDTEIFFNPRMLRKMRQRSQSQSEQNKSSDTAISNKSTDTITDNKSVTTVREDSETTEANSHTIAATEQQVNEQQSLPFPSPLDDRLSSPPVLNNRFSSINPYGPVDPFAFYNELPASVPLSYDSSAKSRPHATTYIANQSLGVAPLPQTNGYTIHELPSTEFLGFRTSRVSSISSYQGYCYSPSITSEKSPTISIAELPSSTLSETYQRHGQKSSTISVAELPTTRATETYRPHIQQSPTTSVVELPSSLPLGTHQDTYRSYYQQSPFIHQGSRHMPYHAQTYPQPSNKSMGDRHIPTISGVISPDISRLSLASPPVPEKLLLAGTSELPSNTQRSIYGVSPLVSPLASTISLVSISSTNLDLSPEAMVRRRRKALRRAVMGDG